ncbi:MAG TPA: hypothetical protein VJZ68_04495 [Nitrososphaera sp.]|uniref:hypothetical protein n=1 Tax=Nitrososphaera sp. TaxID=1971748 RepID=UPI002CD31D77|nr:hypothetical protein [Nitrososphaera sp.]
MVEKTTAVWLIILTLIVCAAVPGILIYVTTIPAAKMLSGFQMANAVAHVIALQQ